MKFVLVLALAALAVAGPVCTQIVNGDFDDANTIAPWMTNAYLGGSENCPGSTGNIQCQLLQQNAVTGNGRFLNNAGRISVGQLVGNDRRCRTHPDEAVGRNVYQQNIGMCRGLTVTADVGFQDESNNPSSARVPQIFALVVGRDDFDINGGRHTEVVRHTFPVPSAAPYNAFTYSEISGVWDGPYGDDCSRICPNENCFSVGVRYARDAGVTRRVRGYIDNLVLTDLVDPEITANDVSAVATSCGASTPVNYSTSATDNCCAVVTIEYSTDDGSNWSTTPSGSFVPGIHTVDVRATDNSGNEATATFMVRIAQALPLISCDDFSAETETCFTQLPAQTQSQGLATRDRACVNATAISYSPILSSSFKTGVTVVTASFSQPNRIGGTDSVSCESTVHFTLCCSATYTAKRNAPATLRKLTKF